MKHETLLKHCETSQNTRYLMRHIGGRCGDIDDRRGDISARHGVSGDISFCGVGITPQMCNRVTNHGDMGTFPNLSANQSMIKELPILTFSSTLVTWIISK